MNYEPRSYRQFIASKDLVFFEVCIQQTDLSIGVSKSIGDAGVRELELLSARLVRRLRNQLEEYAKSDPAFLTGLEPVETDANAPEIAAAMCKAAKIANVGPMAAVAGAIAQMVGQEILRLSPDVIVENGGDIFIKSTLPRKIGISAGKSPLSGRIALEIAPDDTPAGICTSSGTVGHSLSLGKADAATVVAVDAFLADAAATALGNRIKHAGDLKDAVGHIAAIRGVKGALAILGDRLSAAGDIKIAPV